MHRRGLPAPQDAPDFPDYPDNSGNLGERRAVSFFDLSQKSQVQPRISSGIDEYLFFQDIQARRLWFNTSVESREESENYDTTTLLVTDIVHHIIQYNRDDDGIDPGQRRPIKLYINSPGGDIYEGFALIDAIRLSETPVYTYNVGMCASMGFLIYIAGHKRLTLPHAMFLLHDGWNGNWSSSSKFIDIAEFNKRYEKDVIRAHVLQQTSISGKDYDDNVRKEWYMLPADAINLGVAHKIATSMSDLI